MKTTATADLDELADGFRRFLCTTPQSGSYGPDDIASICADINRMRDGWRPSPEDLAATARIDDWSVCGPQDQEILFGWISRHPWNRRRQRSNTAGIVLVDRDLRWMRTVGRLYELGAPKGTEQAEMLLALRVV